MKFLTFVLACIGWLLCGCAPIIDTLKPVPYEPHHTAVIDGDKIYIGALTDCQAFAAENIKGGKFDTKRVSFQGGKGGISNLPAGAIAAILPAMALGALSGIGTESFDELLGSQDDTNRITTWCMRDKGQETGDWSVWDQWLSK